MFHNVYAGIACYTVFQMIAMAVIVVSCISVLIRRRAGKKLCFCFLLFYALVPYNGIFAVTMWKDILFSGVLLLFVLCIYRFLPFLSGGKAALSEASALPFFSVMGNTGVPDAFQRAVCGGGHGAFFDLCVPEAVEADPAFSAGHIGMRGTDKGTCHGFPGCGKAGLF